jgi:bifunctional non-homologous end joining protein LigD
MPRKWGGNLPSSQETNGCTLLVQKSSREKSVALGRVTNCREKKECRWVKPKLVCQVAFVQWTDAGHLRHCTFVAMRDDKKPAEVVRET